LSVIVDSMGGSSKAKKSAQAGVPADGAPAVAPASMSTAVDFWEQIRQHKVAQWGLAYLGTALALAHGQELVAHAFEWPEFVGRVLISLLVLGFPVALTVAWYHGHHGLKRLTAGEMTIISLLILIAAGLLVVLVRPSEKAGVTVPDSAVQDTAVVRANTIAVLPFDNMSSDAGQEFFCDGISEEILNALVRLPGMQVVGRTSSFSFKGKNTDLRTIGRMLGVATLVEGSVRRQGDQVRISAQLVRASDGVELWSQSFDRNVSDVLKLQEEIADAIAAKIGGGRSHQTASATNGPAYEQYLEGLALLHKGDIDSEEKGITALEKAVVLDPNLAPAWAALADAYGFQYLFNKGISFDQARARVAAARERALELDPKSTEALLAHPGNFEMNNNWAELGAREDSALAANPRDAQVLFNYASFLVSTGHVSRSVSILKRAYELDPLSPNYEAAYGYALYISGGHAAQGKALLDQALALNPMNFYPRFLRESLSLGEGDMAAAVADQRFLLEHAAFDDRQRAFGARLTALALAGDRKALRDLVAQGVAEARAGKLHTDWMDLDRWAMVAGDARLSAAAMRDEDARPDTRFSFIWRWAPLFAPARAQPDFKAVVAKHKLPDFWRSHGWPDFCSPAGPADFHCH
jgi:TolB-like protein/Tfp pilus assembly protein PilF